MSIAQLPDRGVIEISGADRVSFLQGLVSNDVEQAAPGRAVWAALLTPQGKYHADFFILADGDRLLLDCERAAMPDLATRLSRHRLRAAVAVAATGLHVAAAWGEPSPIPASVAAPDPRLPEAGWRIVSAASAVADASFEDWDTRRLALGLPDGSRDIERDKTVLLEAGFDELQGVSWTKGCYLGQELTARTKYRGLVKRRLVPVEIDGAPAEPGAMVLRDGVEVGTMRSSRGGVGLAVLRIDALRASVPLRCGGATVTPRVPAWLRLTEPMTA